MRANPTIRNDDRIDQDLLGIFAEQRRDWRIRRAVQDKKERERWDCGRGSVQHALIVGAMERRVNGQDQRHGTMHHSVDVRGDTVSSQGVLQTVTVRAVLLAHQGVGKRVGRPPVSSARGGGPLTR